MAANPAISVIVPVYNAEKYLERCVDSLLGQTFSDLELILVDDGSTDGSPALCDAYRKADPRVIVEHCSNGGVSSARNKGLSLATGAYVSFVDSDDYLAKDAYEKLMRKAVDRNADVVYSDYATMGEDGRPDPQKSSEKGGSLHATISNRLLQDSYPGTIWNFLLVRHDLIVRNGISFSETFNIGEDFIFCIETYLASDVIEKVDEPLYHYYLGNSQSATFAKLKVIPEQDIRWLEAVYGAFRKSDRFDEFAKELYYRTLITKTSWIVSPRRFGLYYKYYPEANSYSDTCPLLGKGMKTVMKLLNKKRVLSAALLVTAYKIKNRIHA